MYNRVRSLTVDGSYMGEVVLCLGLVDDSRAHGRYMEPCL